MITKADIKNGILNGSIKFIVDPNMESGTVCSIGDYWFYFGGIEAEEINPEEYLDNVPIEDIANEIYDALESMDDDECGYYEAILRERKTLEILDWLLTHNKNYTKEQYYKLLDLKDILEG